MADGGSGMSLEADDGDNGEIMVMRERAKGDHALHRSFDQKKIKGEVIEGGKRRPRQEKKRRTKAKGRAPGTPSSRPGLSIFGYLYIGAQRKTPVVQIRVARYGVGLQAELDIEIYAFPTGPID